MNIFRTEEERDAYQTGYEAGYKASEDEFHAPLLGTEKGLTPTGQHIATCEAALALLRELNDALVIPGWLQPRVDAVLDRAEEK